ncbi:APC family permease [Acidaminobacter sp.]|uniref:APC family permease n=1 Tax=Acidaminobacter sp. TaxID=1872102 RepID=UPI0013804E64|nr:APC family permease [Acidaminobacter sp.]MDK9711916.1 APC family permease [Acidaminobacter sp.]MZQ97313.1 amino acid permease [Acidaminobacter sp.]
MKQTVETPKLERSISFIGFLGMGIGCVFGSSWLLMAGYWMTAAGGPVNAALAFAAGLIMIMTLALSYISIMPAFPEGGGEMQYARRAFGNTAGLIAGWSGFLVNGIVSAWQTLAITRMAETLFPALSEWPVVYHIGSEPVTVAGLLIGFFLVAAIAFLQYRGTRLFARLQSILVGTVLLLVISAIIAGLFYADPGNLRMTAEKPLFEGAVAFLVLLPFSIAGWENIAKGVEEARASLSIQKIGQALMWSILISTFLYAGLFFLQASLVPWPEMTQSKLPLVDSLVRLTGHTVFRVIILSAAIFNVLGVFNGVFYGAVRSLYALGNAGLLPRVFSRIHPTYKTPHAAIITVAVLVGITPLIGNAAFGSLVKVAAFFYVVLWGSTVLSARKLQLQLNILSLSPFKTTAVRRLISTGGIIAALFILAAMIWPTSPGALSWPGDYGLLALLICPCLVFHFLKRTGIVRGASSMTTDA